MSSVSDHAKHLRLTQFSLLVACVVIVISTLLGKEQIYTQALEEAETISRFHGNDFKDIYNYVIEQAVMAAPKKNDITQVTKIFRMSSSAEMPVAYAVRNPENSQKNISVEVVPVRLISEFKCNTNLWLTAVGVFPQSAVSTTDEDQIYGGQGIISTLGDFRAIWNNLLALDTFHAITHVSVEKATLNVQGSRAWDPISAPGQKPRLKTFSVPLPVKIETQSEIDEWDHTEHLFEDTESFALLAEITNRSPSKNASNEELISRCPQFGPYKISIKLKNRVLDSIQVTGFDFPDQEISGNVFIPVEHSVLHIDGQGYFTNEIDGKTLKRGTFEKAFPALSKVMKNVDGIKLENLNPFLDQQLAIVGERFSLFGVKASASQITTWGGLILAGIMFYFVVHLRAFSRRYAAIVELDEFPWIGLYADPLAKGLYVVSVVLLPTGVSIWQLFQDEFSCLQLFFSILVAAGAVMAVHAIIPLWRKIATKGVRAL